MSFKSYADVTAKIAGQLFSEAAKIGIKRSSGAKENHTMLLGFAGMSKGSAIMDVSVEAKVPAAGFEYDPGPDILAVNPVDLIFILGDGTTLTTKGYPIDDDLNKAVDQEMGLSMNFKCAFENWDDSTI